jgi:cytochrome c oxidase subunit IV
MAQEQSAQVKMIWRVFYLLLIVTAIEFALAYMMDRSTLRVSIFIGLTLFKAFYIVAEFMHLKHEVKALIWTIVVPCIFVFWLLVALLYEGDSVIVARDWKAPSAATVKK